MWKIVRTGVILLALTSLAACSAQPVAPGMVVAASEKPRVTAPQVAEADLDALVRGNTAFAFELYRSLAQLDQDNLFLSPYSISLALAMTYAGARGTTEQQMAEALHFTLPQERLHPAVNSLDLLLKQRGEGARGMDGEGFRLNIVNALWGQKDYEFLQPFLDVLAENYGAGLNLLDFVSAAEEARRTINDWVSEETEGRIEDLLPEGSIDALTRLVLTNAIYFNAAWARPFEKDLTIDGPFYLLDGREITVPLMRQQTSLAYAEGDGYQMVELPYDGWELSMVILLPERERFSEFEAGLDADTISAMLQDLSREQVALAMPRFEMESQFSLVNALSELGMPVAFTEDADFSGMDGTRDLLIGDVVHKSFVLVDEAGTEAAAATAVIMEVTSMPAEPVTMTINHPFIFLIRDIETGTVLFLGRVMNPQG